MCVCANFGGSPASFPDDYTEIWSVGVLPVVMANIAHPSLGSQTESFGVNPPFVEFV